jgi:hypothetical protein
MSVKVIGIHFIVVALCSLFAGCAIIDCSSLETAETLAPGKTKLIHEQVNPVVIENMIPYGIYEEHDYNIFYPLFSNTKFGIGVEPNAEIDLSLSLHSIEVAGKIGLDSGNEKIKLALMPAVSYGASGDQPMFSILKNSTFQKSEIAYMKYGTIGIASSFLATYSMSKYFSLSTTAKLDYYHIHYRKYVDQSYSDGYQLDSIGNFININGGFYLTPKVKLGMFVLMPEIGLYAYKYKNGVYGCVPVVNFAAGLEFGK